MNIKIYSKTGDTGSTSLFGGMRVDKDSKRLAAYGTVDELNSQIGVVLAELNSPVILNSIQDLKKIPKPFGFAQGEQVRNDKFSPVISKLDRIQGELFILGWDLATPLNLKVTFREKTRSKRASEKLKVKRIRKSYIERLESDIDTWTKELPEIKNFILPGGGKVGAGLHLARTIARRAERETVGLLKKEPVNKNAIIYLNRLSDWLFTLARYANHQEKIVETYWRGR